MIDCVKQGFYGYRWANDGLISLGTGGKEEYYICKSKGLKLGRYIKVLCKDILLTRNIHVYVDDCLL